MCWPFRDLHFYGDRNSPRARALYGGDVDGGGSIRLGRAGNACEGSDGNCDKGSNSRSQIPEDGAGWSEIFLQVHLCLESCSAVVGARAGSVMVARIPAAVQRASRKLCVAPTAR